MNLQESIVLGVDGGGTGTTARLADRSGNTFGEGTAGASNVKSAGDQGALLALDRAISQAFSAAKLERARVDIACLGLAGFDRPEDRRLLIEWNDQQQWARRLVLVNDGELVIAAGSAEGWGVGVIAGTGSIAVAKSRDGRSARAGGWGRLFGDEGSAYAAAIAGLRLAARRSDGRSPIPPAGDVLTQGLLEALNIDTPAQLVTAVYAQGVDHASIAALARVVVAAARSGDERARVEILEKSGADLAETVLAAARSAGIDLGLSTPLAIAGSFVLRVDEVRNALVSALERAGAIFVPALVPQPVAGAVALAVREASP